MNTCLALLSIFFTITSLTLLVSSEFEASPLPQPHTAVTHPPSYDSSTFCLPHSSSVNPSIRLTTSGNNIIDDSTERDGSAGFEGEEVKLDTSDAPNNDFAVHAMVLLLIVGVLASFGAQFVKFILLPLAAIIIFGYLFVAYKS